MKLHLSKGEAYLRVIYRKKLVEPRGAHPSEHRTTTVKIEFVRDLTANLEATVSCSHLDQFTRLGGRREAMRKLFAVDNGRMLITADRAIIASVLVGHKRQRPLAVRVRELEAEIARRNEIKLHGVNFGPGTNGIEMKLGGEAASIFLYTLVEFFYANGGKNYLTLTVEKPAYNDRPAAHLEVTIRNCDGTLTPAEHIGQLKDALSPFAKLWEASLESIPADHEAIVCPLHRPTVDNTITVGDIRRAKAAIGGKDEPAENLEA